MDPLLATAAASIALLALHALALHAGAAAFLVGRLRGNSAAGDAPPRAISVLVPAREEGRMALRVVRSLLEQDTPASVDVYLLLADARDGSWPHLAEAYRHAPPATEASSVELLRDAEAHAGPRSLTVVFTGVEGKAEKLNRVLPALPTPLVAVLDCDHQARPDWLRSAAARLAASGARIVQCRRHGLRADGLFSLWDSLHQHIGCEVFNVAFGAAGLTVFLTGTTFVADTALLAAHPFRACLTEDVDLSYHLLMRGERAVADLASGSDEEVSPDLASFLARRRRWANGHTLAFLRHLPSLRRAPLRLRERVQFLFHGVHYLVALLVFALHLVLGLHFARALPAEAGLLALSAGVLAALALTRVQRAPGAARRALEVGVLTLWLAPLAVLVLHAAHALLLDEPERMALALPSGLGGVALAALLAPLVVLLVGLIGFGLFTPSLGLAVLVTFPLAFYLDLAAVLLGLTDALVGGARWHRIHRATPALELGRGGLTPLVRITESWRPRALLTHALRLLAMTLPRRLRSPATYGWALVLVALGAGFVHSRATRVEQAPRACRLLPHDTDPWIVPPERIAGYCESTPAEGRWSRPASRFEPAFVDPLSPPGPSRWERLGTTFDCNLARFAPEQVEPAVDGGAHLVLREQPSADRAFTSGALATHEDAEHRYGRFEAVLRPARGSGLITAFFLHRRDPWQEIDVELLGRDTTRVLFNVYFNPGEDGARYNYGYAGTPVLVELGFDAAADFHRYAIEWDVDEVRFFVDDALVHRRRAGRPTPIPHLPMRLHLNLWANCSEALVGPVDRAALPAVATFREVRVATRHPQALLPIARFFDGLLGPGPTGSELEPSVWQDEAEWLTRYRE